MYEKYDIFSNNSRYEYPKLFTWVCSNGHFDVVKWLIEIAGDYILDSKRYSYSLKFALQNGHYDISNYLMALKPDSTDHLTNLQPFSNPGMRNDILKSQMYVLNKK